VTKVLFIAPISVCGAPVSGGEQRTRLIFDALAWRYDVDAMVVGAGVNQMHKAPFVRAASVHEALHASPGAMLFGSLYPRLQINIADKIAAALLPRVRAYAPDALMTASLANVDFSAYDLIVSRFLRPAARTGALAASIGASGRGTPVIVDVDDRDDHVFASRLERNRFNPALGALNRWHAAQARAIMRDRLPAARHLWFVSEDDMRDVDHASMSVLANIPYGAPPHDVAPPDSKAGVKTILFAGHAGHEPNRQGLMRFLRNCWPKIAARAPDAMLRIIGSGWEGLPADLAARVRVERAGFVDDLAAEYRRAHFVVSPVYEGAGVKIKVIEALAHGRAVVADSHSARGFPEKLRADCIVSAAGDKEMVEACLRLLVDPDEAARRGLAGRAHALASYTRERFEEIVVSDCERVLAQAASPKPSAVSAAVLRERTDVRTG